MNPVFKASLFSMLLCVVPFTASAQTGTPSTGWFSADPWAQEFTINSADELAGLALIVNGLWRGSPSYSNFNNKTVKLTQDVDLSVYDSSYNNGAGWIPIGDSSSANRSFCGVFEGNGHTVSGLYINRNKDWSGLFGYVNGSSSRVKNLIIEDANVTGTKNVGAAAGFINVGSLINVSVSGSVKGTGNVGGIAGYVSAGGSITESSFKGVVKGNNHTGGIAGYFNSNNIVSSLTKSYFKGKVSGNEFVGALAGYSYQSNISNCYAAAKVNGFSSAGGLVGRHLLGSIANCYFRGSVSSDSIYAGGLAGYFTGILSNSYSAAYTVTGENNVGGIVGSLTGSGRIENCAALNFKVNKTSNVYNSVGRITGLNGGTLSNNFAWDSTIINRTPVSGPIPPPGDGANISSSELFDGSVKGLFVNDTNSWITSNCKLPGLSIFGSFVDIPAYLVNLDLLVKWIEMIEYNTIEEIVTDVISANAKISAIVDSLTGYNLNKLNIGATVNDLFFMPATSGTSTKPNGTDGFYVFTVDFSDSSGNILADTKVLTLTIKATPYNMRKSAEPIVSEAAAEFANKLTAGPNPVLKHSGSMNFFWQGMRVQSGTLYIYAASGNLVNKINVKDNGIAGDFSRRQIGKWDLTNSKGRSVPAGTYAVKGTITGQDGGKEIISLSVGVR